MANMILPHTGAVQMLQGAAGSHVHKTPHPSLHLEITDLRHGMGVEALAGASNTC